MIGSLLYLMTSRPNIMFSICLCARFQFYLKESHFSAVKSIIKYLKGTIGIGLWYLKTRQFNMTSYLDADYDCYRVDRKSTSETCQFLENCLVSWSVKKQNFIALLTVEAKYVALGLIVHKLFR